MQYITQQAKDAISSSVQVRASLMRAFNKSEKTIQNWVENDSPILSTPIAVTVIKQETGLTESEILEPQTA